MARAPDSEAVFLYHERTTHHPGRYARGPGFLDWDSQPEPFRTYAGAAVVLLPLAGEELTVTWGDLHRPGSVPPRPLGRSALGAFFELALGLTAWKEHRGSRWALRANPSSGNLHPTEGYALLPETSGVPAGLHHYLSRDHVLERRGSPTPAGADLLARLLPSGAFLLGLASIHWREAWKYGERAFRYCQHDVGHALAAVRYAAAVLGWSARLLDAPGDDDVSALLGLDRDTDFASAAADREHPDGLLLVAPLAGIEEATVRIERGLGELRECLRGWTWTGLPNRLSPAHVEWPAIADVAAATAKPRTPVAPKDSGGPGPEGSATLADPSSPGQDGAPRDDGAGRSGDGLPAMRLIRQRRSAVAMDGVTGLPAAALFALLDRLLPRPGVPPWDTLPWAPCVHPVFFVHRVDGLAPGLYLLDRARGAIEDLRRALRPSFAWRAAESRPAGFPLYLLEPGDARSFARFASCHQEIASDSAFAVAMLADLRRLDAEPWWYRRAHWEAGVLGQVLYLEAEAAGSRGTGIGCFFNDVVHETLGLADDRFRDLYHFTVGRAVEDHRLATRSGYDEPVRRRS
jgi:SagB-type dehydrogenase family enzyme